jgi:hypothetical protein
LKLYDSKGHELKLGDIVKVSDGKRFTFFCEVKYLEKEKVITPFHTFSFMHFVKVDEVPAEATKSTEERYAIWYLSNDPEEDTDGAEGYLMDWIQCEHLLSKGCYRIELNK